MAAVRRSRVLIVDDSAIVRTILSNALKSEPDIEVVGLAADPYVARDLIETQRPDIITLDLEMPRMDGLTFLRQLMAQHPLPVVIVSSATQTGSAATIDALAAGAIDVIAKPGGPYSVADIAEQLKYRIRALRSGRAVHFARLRKRPALRPAPASLASTNGLILMGASTGGTQAIEAVLTRLPADTPPIVIVQHMPAPFTRAFAARLDRCCPMQVIEAGDNEPVKRGVAYIAPGDSHLLLMSRGGELRTSIEHGARIHYQRPSVDVLFFSAATLRGVPIVALLLTGMGSDGADGMVALREMGATTIAEDERSCVVFGMPAAAIAKGGATHVAPCSAMPRLIAETLSARQRQTAVQSADRARPAFRHAP
ncbi:MAG TPA: chemotaxis response regulator protein-glutamate methylesterase [Vicinamibacterales bacterium]|nr:chemotaxis response regulator protein-glutamate methylesterase [Vicinamibacterales bacterium]